MYPQSLNPIDLAFFLSERTSYGNNVSLCIGPEA
jgi:hypothetical protein